MIRIAIIIGLLYLLALPEPVYTCTCPTFDTVLNNRLKAYGIDPDKAGKLPLKGSLITLSPTVSLNW